MKRILVANRGEIALRILRSCESAGIEGYLAASEADMESLPASLAKRTVCIGPARASQSYLFREGIIATALALGCEGIHPGYGFLAEDHRFAQLCTESALSFIGPRAEVIELFGNKVSAKETAQAAGVPVIQGSPMVTDLDEAIHLGREVGYPLMLKAVHGGGGKGMRIILGEEEMTSSFPVAVAEASSAFGDGRIYLERWLENARHIEVQIVGSAAGEVIHLGTRDCSVQRRNQKMLEEAPAPHISEDVRERMCQAARSLAAYVAYDSVGTVEFLYEPSTDEFFFLEVNPRIQVEHPVTEMITGQDIVQLQIKVAATGELPIAQKDVSFLGAALECRINAEDPAKDFAPSPGTITDWNIAQTDGVRVDSHCFRGYTVPPYYDSLLGKVVVHDQSRVTAIERMERVIESATVGGIKTNLKLLRGILGHPEFQDVSVYTQWLDERVDPSQFV